VYLVGRLVARGGLLDQLVCSLSCFKRRSSLHASLPTSGKSVLDQSTSHIHTSYEIMAALEAKVTRKEALVEET
jgi:hypothetical protein